MRVWLSGPRVMGVRTGVSFGPEDFRSRQRRVRQSPPQPVSAATPKDAMICVVGDGGSRSLIMVDDDPNEALAILQSASSSPLRLCYAAAVKSGNVEAIARAAINILASHSAGGAWYNVMPDMAVAAIGTAAYRCKDEIATIPVSAVSAVTKAARNVSRPRRGIGDLIGMAIFKAIVMLLKVGAAAILTGIIIGCIYLFVTVNSHH